MIKNGELFAMPLPGVGFVSAHVVFSLEHVEQLGLVPQVSLLRRYGSLLVDVYGPATVEPSSDANEMLIHGIWIDDRSIAGRDRPRWQRIGKRDVDPTSVEFSELVLNDTHNSVFVRGEIKKPLPYKSREVDRIDACTPFIAAGTVAMICMNLLGRGDLLGEQRILFELDGRFDLRYNANRDAVYREMGVEPTRGYFEWATAEGLDPGRFWR
ncbi:MAG: hypothetical protein ABI591_25750 [Kofleriaceae bacterium]